MRYIFLDNFRGFQDTFVPIQDVNFLVGENTTGKTSLLGVLKLLSSPQFWFEHTFECDEVNFGHFKDIVSVHSKDRSYFTVGLIETIDSQEEGSEKSKDKNEVRGFLMTFRAREGMPQLSQYTWNSGKKEFNVKFTTTRLWIKKNIIKKTENIEGFREGRFKSWITNHQVKGTSGFQKLDVPFRMGNLPIVFILSLLENHSENEKTIDPKKEFNLPKTPFSILEIAWLAPIRSKPRRTYDEFNLEFSPEGDHTPYLIKKILDSENDSVDFHKFIKKVGQASGLFDSLQIKRFGRAITSPFEVDIVINKKSLNVSNVGYGVSQALPVIVELLLRSKGSWFAIQQPEVHLHPKAQAAFGDVFFELAVLENKHFLIETHSDFMIDRFLLNYRNKRKKKPEAQILFFERINSGNKVTSIPINKEGEMSTNQPKGYRQFFIKEEMKLLGL